MSQRNPDPAWTSYFFSGSPPRPEFNNLIHNAEDWLPFPYLDQPWQLGRQVSNNIPYGHPQLVFYLYSKQNDTTIIYVAKTFTNPNPHRAKAQLQRIPSKHHTVEMLVKDLDPFYLEANALEHIHRFCPDARKIYFPAYHGVITDIPYSRLSDRLRPRQRAVVLERLEPTISHRRILGAATPDISTPFYHSLEDLSICPFEIDWYASLAEDRCRRVNALLDIGIVHGDIRDDHFRLPGDFYDIVLYDFSMAYTFTPIIPYTICFTTPKPLEHLRMRERNHVHHTVYKRVEQRDFYHHVIESLQMQPKDIQDLFISPIEGVRAILDMVVLRVARRPDPFTMPSSASVFQFLEAVCPKDRPTWYVTTARQLGLYEAAWGVGCQAGGIQKGMELVTLGDEILVNVDELGLDGGEFFLLVLIPKAWMGGDDVERRIKSVCERVMDQGEESVVLGREEFDQL
ncbi:hypothetical protein BO94DRAFT_583912 [Aspergillus sclerotioniger CBS 115572]|uniref:Uncharacterized protein n=1 Tax=Aspergillus sclerotioniger CBS 115572 TaxID=1450535 RepID=A0A317WZ88_9EURO|nr:hypothetical protein BO94DRAFT_583912 [Aspergillus sclerotioniger CBS 115572]PWY91291.1 hypothetical protein BO94DRAFT_583912 [Aspergillus sclerotioniger CBS 115572]